jgi:hypothetical protein
MSNRRQSIWAALALAGLLACASAALASIQDDDICWSPDIEFPTTCDEDEE